MSHFKPMVFPSMPFPIFVMNNWLLGRSKSWFDGCGLSVCNCISPLPLLPVSYQEQHCPPSVWLQSPEWFEPQCFNAKWLSLPLVPLNVPMVVISYPPETPVTLPLHLLSSVSFLDCDTTPCCPVAII